MHPWHRQMEDLRGKLGMPAGANIMADYMAGQNSAMHTAAQNMASLMVGKYRRFSTRQAARPALIKRRHDR